jgi:hypothetical protein
MITTLVLIFAALLLLAVLAWAAQGRLRALSLDELGAHTQPVDLTAFRNLIDNGEEEYLRSQLAGRDFRSVQRQRMRAALDYVRRAARNAVCLMSVGEAGRRSPDPAVARAGQELVNAALRLRTYSLFAILVLYARIVAPGARGSVAALAERYQLTRDQLTNFTRVQRPAYATRVAAVL